MIITPLTKPELFNYSPHQGFMLLIDRVEDYSLEQAYLISSVYVTPQSTFFDAESGMVPCWISFEYMAQNIALLSGISSVLKAQKPKIGFIMAIRDFSTYYAGFTSGSRVSILVKQIFRDGDVAVFNGKALINKKEFAKGTISTISANDTLIKKMTGNKNE
jgi:predicted hotdog family 3-hydroxylacyl-ACP dehydratase